MYFKQHKQINAEFDCLLTAEGYPLRSHDILEICEGNPLALADATSCS